VNSIDVIVPIFNAPDDVSICLDALVQHTPAFARIWLVDDASSDPRIAPMLSAFKSKAHLAVEILVNPKNLGFVGSVNRGIGAVKGDVLLLNSDAIVTAGWLNAIAAAAESVPNAASITPWSNNAEICSFPNFCINNVVPSDLNPVAQACAEITPQYPELPTGVGFCMFMRQSAIRRFGVFDGATFGRGYGEENDWCRRVAGFGMRNILCDNAYVAHSGGRSFAATGEVPGGVNLSRLNARYPNYNALVAQFVETDPLAAARARLQAVIARHQFWVGPQNQAFVGVPQ
jgi:GT2 family glycosyltransferase